MFRFIITFISREEEVYTYKQKILFLLFIPFYILL